MRWYDTVFLALFSIIVAGTTHAREIDETVDYFKVEAYRYYYGKDKPIDYAKALQLYRQAAERGDAEAQFIVGGMFYLGKGVAEPDKKIGFKWLLSAAEQGKTSPESLSIIGGAFLRGNNVPQNYLEAKKWLTEAAEQGDLSAQNDLAYLFFNGLGGERDYKKALELYEKAAMQGDSMAQANVGLMYATGTGINTDKARGYAWYSLAASAGNTFATISRNNLMLNMNWEELNQAQAISFELYHRIEKMAKTEPFEPNPVQK
jgi:TPR repeat protein